MAVSSVASDPVASIPDGGQRHSEAAPEGAVSGLLAIELWVGTVHDTPLD